MWYNLCTTLTFQQFQRILALLSCPECLLPCSAQACYLCLPGSLWHSLFHPKDSLTEGLGLEYVQIIRELQDLYGIYGLLNGRELAG